jgi:leucyl aminopeptidase/proline iminopeptidase
VLNFEYRPIDVVCVSDANPQTCVLEWRAQSQLVALQGNQRDRCSHLSDGHSWTFVKRKDAANAFERLTQARKAIQGSWHHSDTTLTLIADDAEGLDALLSAALANTYQLPTHKREADPQPQISRIELVGELSSELIQQRQAEAEGNALTRFLATRPVSDVNPTSYREWLLEWAPKQGIEVIVHDYASLEKMGAGAFCAVARGADDGEASIVELRYAGQPDSEQHTALVGKGVCMDTGGYNLKTGGYMFGMHGDMTGSAVVVGTLLSAVRQQQAINLRGWLALVNNHIGPKAYHANEIVTALNGTSIEIVDTDAEGRMVLADTLTLASREKPQQVIDYATLTGTCVSALGTRTSGAFTNQDEWTQAIIDTGRVSGERVWPMPLDKDYDDDIDSDIADVQQCNPGRAPDHINAARFLSRFIEHDTPWLHIDLSAAEHKGGLAHVATEQTGFGVRFTQAWLKR